MESVFLLEASAIALEDKPRHSLFKTLHLEQSPNATTRRRDLLIKTYSGDQWYQLTRILLEIHNLGSCFKRSEPEPAL